MTASQTRNATPTVDGIRRSLVQWFYDLNRKGGAPRGMRDLCAGIKSACGFTAPTVKGHLTFLVDLGYIRKEVTMTQVRTGKTVRDQARATYRITAKGIAFMEGRSAFSDKERYAGINVTATGGSMVVLGDGNVVNSTHRALYDELSRMRLAVADSTELNDSTKLEASVSIETIKDQLALARPDPTVVERAWETATRLCTTATLGEYATRLGPFIATLIGGS